MTVFAEADLVFAYARAQALADGELVDVTPMARQAGIRYPVAITRAAWSAVVEPPPKARARGESVAGRLWDVLRMFVAAARRQPAPTDRLAFELLVTGDDGRRRRVTLKAICGPGDDGKPVITILLPDED